VRHSSLGWALAGIGTGLGSVLLSLGMSSSVGSWSLGIAGTALAGASLGPLGRAVFGQRPPEHREVSWVPGGGTHGGLGGQVPPYVPYDPDWDPKNRER
jgi:hypothetical protein